MILSFHSTVYIVIYSFSFISSKLISFSIDLFNFSLMFLSLINTQYQHFVFHLLVVLTRGFVSCITFNCEEVIRSFSLSCLLLVRVAFFINLEFGSICLCSISLPLISYFEMRLSSIFIKSGIDCGWMMIMNVFGDASFPLMVFIICLMFSILHILVSIILVSIFDYSLVF